MTEEKKVKKEKFLDDIQDILKKNKVNFTIGTGYNFKTRSKAGYLKVNFLTFKGIDFGAIATTAKKIGIAGGVKVKDTSIRLDFGVVASLSELINMIPKGSNVKLKPGLFMGVSYKF